MKPIIIAGYDSVANGEVDEYFQADLVLDKHRLRSFFVLCNTGRHDLIVGCKFLEDADVWVNCKRKQFIWPDKHLPDVKRDTLILTHIPRIPEALKEAHQADADRRDAQMAAEDKSFTILKR
ncbi:uncharacterized protein EI97DRAFT_443009 [Westerdykella ornata]|uniref:Uncharacterized protein n=1 Tax=Westerdykella ornata TaxID=318751 RepID=A0A6A6JGU2_WESOR|nr:uncharacterized protein EI97DRAFT_443009 [Westerdykella ornata]KAF2275567.1 hypothetical protein EI97DRAFT_443009 [Westerdykella ornata]